MQKKNLNMRILLCMIFLYVTLVMIMPAIAETYYCPIDEENHTVTASQKLCIEMANSVSDVDFLKDDEGTGFSVPELLKFDVDTNPMFHKLWYGNGNGGINVSQIYQSMMPIGIVLIVAFFALELGEKVFTDNFNLEQFASSVMKLVTCLIIALNGQEILTLITQICSTVFTAINNATSIIKPNKGICYFNVIQDMNIFEMGGFMLSMMLSYFFMLLSRFVILTSAWKRAFDIVIYSMFFPIGISDIVKGGVESSGVRYMKVVLAKFLQGSVCLAILMGYNLVSSLALSTGSAAGALGSVILALTVMTLMMQSDSISQSIVGA